MKRPYSKVFLALTVAFTACASAAPAAPSAHQQAVTAARAGRFDAAIPLLQKLVQEHPSHQAYRFDLVAVLSWADRHVEAEAAGRALKLDDSAPAYVLAALGKSAMEAGQTGRAEAAYQALALREPRNAGPQLGWALALLANQKPALADGRLARTLVFARENPVMLQTAVDTLTARGESVRAQPFQQRLQKLGAANTAAVQRPLNAPAAVTASVPLGSVAAPQAAALPPSGAATLAQRQESNGQQIRLAQARLDQDFTAGRYTLIDAALAGNAALIAEAESTGQADVLRRLRFDRIVALKDRRMAEEALAQFESIDQPSATLPAYVLNAAADAAMQLRRPEAARALYARSLAAEPGNLGTQSGLMYAQLEAENFPAAENTVGQMLAQTQQSAGIRRTEATLMRFGDRIEAADQAIQRLATELPNDAGIWLAQADLLAQRGLPRAAAARYADVLAVAPDSIGARVGLADATWAQGDIIEAGRLVAALKADAPEHSAVQRLLQAWQRRERPFLTSTVTKGFGQGAVSGNNDLVWESTVYSGQTDEGVRVFANHHLSNAQFNGQSASHERVGMGLEWTRRDLQATLEVGQDLRNAKDNMWAASAGWQVNDQVSLRARHESQTNDFPLKGRLPDAESWAPTYLHASKTLVGAAYRWNESRRVAADMAYYDFNDGNRRQALSLAWFERLHSGYGKTLDFQAAGYTSSNTLQDAIYFNPKRDVAVSATLTADWQTWRRYDRSFNQRLSATVGAYRQTSDVRQDDAWVSRTYGWNLFEEARYEHEWQFGPERSTRYGVGVRRFPYDGKYETKSYVYLNFNWRF